MRSAAGQSVAGASSRWVLLLDSLLRRGPSATVRMVAEELCFDCRYRLETQGWIGAGKLARLGTRGSRQSSEYQPVPVALFRAAIGCLPESARRGTFVDLGAGKGRALVLAAEAGFRSLLGVERVPELVEIATRNLRDFEVRSARGFEWRMVSGDAADFEPPADATTIFLFHPFGERVLRRVLRRLAESVETRPRLVGVVYVNPVHRHVLDDDASVRRLAEGRTRAAELPDWTLHALGPASASQGSRDRSTAPSAINSSISPDCSSRIPRST